MTESRGMSGVLGADAESPAEGSAPETATPLDPTAAALAAEAAKSDPELSREASAYFRRQSHLVDVQTEHLHEQRAVNLQLLKLRRFDERLRVGLRIFVILVATVIGIFGAVLLHDAVTSRSVVIEPFETPRALAERGLTGTVVAGGVLDQLTNLQAATRTSIQRRNLSNAWSKEVKLTVPETGISIGEISQLLKARFGHDFHIGGDVTQTVAGDLKVAVRGDGLLPRTFTGASEQLPKLTTEVAEYVYSQSQPGLWATYLVDSARYQEAIEFCQASMGSSSKSDRPVLLTYWAAAVAKSSGDWPQALSLMQRAVALEPDYWTAHHLLMALELVIGDEEGVWKSAQELRKIAGGQPGRAPEATYEIFNSVTWDIQAIVKGINLNAESTSGTGTYTFATGPYVAFYEAFLHDPVASELALRATKPDASDQTIGPLTHLARGLMFGELGDRARAVSELEPYLAAYFANPAVVWATASFHCWVAPAEEAAGYPDKADAILKTGGAFEDCYRFHGDILDARGDWKGAQEWYDKSVALAPDLPSGYYSWGVALAKHGDPAGAEAKLKAANQRGSHWADPLKAWGDVLVKQGKTKVSVP
jgi:tetratricopeptide (TPR) repeat protein